MIIIAKSNKRIKIDKALKDVLKKMLLDENQFRRYIVKEDGELVEKLFDKYDTSAFASIVRAYSVLEKSLTEQEKEEINIILDKEIEKYGI